MACQPDADLHELILSMAGVTTLRRRALTSLEHPFRVDLNGGVYVKSGYNASWRGGSRKQHS